MASQTETRKLNTSLKITNLLSFIEQVLNLWSHSKGIFQHLLEENVDVNEANRRTMLTVIFSVKYLAHQCLDPHMKSTTKLSALCKEVL